MKWFTNIVDPAHPSAKERIFTGANQTPEEAWEKQQQMLKGKIIGEPRAASSPSAVPLDKLKELNLVGVYIIEEPNSDGEKK